MFFDQSKFDKHKFESELTSLAKIMREREDSGDMKHLTAIVNWTNFIGLIGIATLWYRVSIIPIFCISTYTFVRTFAIGHHTCHGGYDKVGKGTKYNRFIFALGRYRRFMDWFDWILPEAWNFEHNNRHHYHLGELADPDLPEENMMSLRNANVPLPVKYIIVFLLMITWKYIYYASNTYNEFCIHKYQQSTNRDANKLNRTSMIYSSITKGRQYYALSDLLVNVIGPYFVFRFILLPLPFYYIHISYYKIALINMVYAEILTNFYSFTMIVTNHCGSDVCRFSTPCNLADKGDFYLRQITGSVNYTNGNEIIDYLHGYLNYQIEHHLFPDMTMKSYRLMAPTVKEICKKYGVNYIQENVFIRLKKTVAIFVGIESMKII